MPVTLAHTQIQWVHYCRSSKRFWFHSNFYHNSERTSFCKVQSYQEAINLCTELNKKVEEETAEVNESLRQLSIVLEELRQTSVRKIMHLGMKENAELYI